MLRKKFRTEVIDASYSRYATEDNEAIVPQWFLEDEAKNILDEVEEECGWLYETKHTDGKTKGRINFTVWSVSRPPLFCGSYFSNSLLTSTEKFWESLPMYPPKVFD